VDDVANTSGLLNEDYVFLYASSLLASILGSTLDGKLGGGWQAVWDSGASQDYFKKYDGSDTFRFEPGRGFWLISTSDWSVKETFETVDLEADTAATIDLHNGWNIIANPLDKDVSWSAVGAANGGALQTLWAWTGSFNETQTFTSAKTGEAFYFLNNQGLDQLTIPYPGAPQKYGLAQRQGKAMPDSKAPAFTLSTHQDGSSTSSIVIGIEEDAKAGVDVYDQFAPPGRFEAASLRLRAPVGTESERLRYLAHEYRPLEGQGQVFNLVLRSEPSSPVQVQAHGLGAFRDHKVILINKQSGRPYDLQAQPRVTLTPQAKTTKFRLAFGTAAFVAGEKRRSGLKG